MTAPEQKTLAAEVTLEGTGVHTGESTRVVVAPGKPDSGIRFRRADLEGSPEIAASVENVVSTERCTTLGIGEAKILTVEHLLAAAAALELDNLRVEVEGPELPIGDGSFRPFLDALRNGGSVGQGRPARVIELRRAVTLDGGNGTSYVAAPAGGFRVSATIDFDHPVVGRQYASFDITDKAFAREIAEARTFGFMRDVESLLERGLVRGASMENTIVLDEAGVANGDLRFPDEFVRHKIGDVVGDMALLGGRLRAHVVAERPNHSGSVELVKAIDAAARSQEDVRPVVDIQQIMQHLPHRYPMLLVDRIVEFEPGKRIVGIKNVTINEPFFQGHFPGHPVMPGVLIIEAMGQVGGLLLMDAVEHPETKVVYFMALDKVKWRRPVTPGDQIRFELEMIQFRRHVCRMRGAGYVDGQLAAEAEMMARIVDR